MKKIMQEYSLYNGEVFLTFSEKGHRYKVSLDGKKTWKPVKGVTTYLGILNKEGLIPWAAGQVVEYIKTNCKDGIQYVISEEQLAEAKKAHYTKRDAGADTGTIVHEYIKQYLLGEDPVAPVNEAYEAVAAFHKWEKQYKPIWVASEQPVYSKLLDYCGTFDAIVEIKGKRYLLDFKTSNPQAEYDSYKKKYTGKYLPYREHFFQCGAYSQAYLAQNNLPEGYFDGHIVLYITKAGKTYMYVSENVEDDQDGFSYALELYKLKNKKQEIKEEL